MGQDVKPGSASAPRGETCKADASPEGLVAVRSTSHGLRPGTGEAQRGRGRKTGESAATAAWVVLRHGAAVGAP
jgi:hypothetical protein